MRPTSIRTLDPDAAPPLSVAGGTYGTLVSGKDTGGAYAVISMLVPPGGGPGPHAHAAMQETFYVVAGEVVVRSETQRYVARRGAAIHIGHGGAIHSFRNESTDVAHLLCIVVPAGLEEMFAEVGTPVAPGTFLPLPVLGPEDRLRMQAIAERYGTEMFPPNHLDR